MAERRRCGFCEEGTMVLGKQQELRGGGSEGHWTCETCLMSVKLLDGRGRVLFGVLTAAAIAAVPYMAITDRVARESERPWLVAGFAALALLLAVIFVRDAKAQKKNPPLDG